MTTGIEASPGFHQPLSARPSAEVNSALLTRRPTSWGVVGPRFRYRKWLFVIKSEAPMGNTTKRMNATKQANATSKRIAQRLSRVRFILLPLDSLQARLGRYRREPHR